MFETYEEGRYSGNLIELYLFVYGPEPGHYFAYTNSTIPFIFDEIEYQPIPISRESVKSSGTLDKRVMNVRVPRNTGLADLFRVFPPSYVVTLILRQGHLSDPDKDFLVAWSGKVLGYERQGSEAVMACEPASVSMLRPALRWNYQISCPHLLYGPLCRADQASKTVTATVAGVAGLSVALTPGWNPLPLAKYLQGTFRWTRDEGHLEIRQIQGAADPSIVRLDALLRGLEAGMTVSISAGCNHQTSAPGEGGDCVDLHNNGPNYGGCRWIPLNNPIGAANRF